MAQVLTPDQQIQDDHRQARDGIFDLLQACQERNPRRAREIVDLIDMVAGPHWRWEEEALYPAVGQLSEELRLSLLKEHDEVIEAVQKVTDILKQKNIPPQDWEEIRNKILAMLYHIATCDGLVIMIEKLSDNDLVNIRQAIFVAQRDEVRLLEWAQTLRKKQ
ncbi:MAG: hemerythrin domain-containing protein [Dehalococcoidia bacterium]